MKLTTALLGSMASVASAFPAAVLEAAANNADIKARVAELEASLDKRQVKADGATAIFEAVPNFNAEDQYIDVSEGSGHEWQAPGPNDLRGPCPGL